jgi:mRNA interferase RelE/StbE
VTIALYSVRILKPASRELQKLDPSIAKRIVARIHWLSNNVEGAKLYPLKGGLRGLFKVREVSYRIILEVLRSDRVIVIHSVGHRRDIYKLK